jgi:hypothetical protein
MSAPFPALVSAAAVPGPRLGTFVLNAGFYRPALLALPPRRRARPV